MIDIIEGFERFDDFGMGFEPSEPSQQLEADHQEPQVEEPVSSDDYLSDFLKTRGIDDTSKIKFEDDKVVTIENPKDGGYYASSVKDMFPDSIENKILNFNLDNVNIKSKVDEHYSYLNSSDYVPTEATYEFVAEIIETHENFIIVKPDANSREIKSSDKISVNITRPTNGTNDFYVIGNKVKITYNGEIMETYPAQIIASKVELESQQEITSYQDVHKILVL